MTEHSDDEQEFLVEAEELFVTAQPVELYKTLKIANLVGGGGEAKQLISEGYVAVNGELETRKRRKMYDGDVIEFNGEFFLVVCDQPITEAPVRKAAQPNKTKGKTPKQSASAKSTEKSAPNNASEPAADSGVKGKKPRRSISF